MADKAADCVYIGRKIKTITDTTNVTISMSSRPWISQEKIGNAIKSADINIPITLSTRVKGFKKIGRICVVC